MPAPRQPAVTAPTLPRRALLRAALAVPFALAFRRGARAAGPGALVADPDGVLDLPPGFSYRIVDRRGDPMSDGYRVPGRPDAMGAFAGPDGTIVLMRNHEVGLGDPTQGPYAPGEAPPEAYDPLGMGGVTRVVLDAETLEVRASNLVLAGSIRNCAGGLSPWGWLTCEESVEAGHGYVFLCSTAAEKVAQPQRIVGYGRFYHEAACVDPATTIAYLTEDRSDGCLYRFVPADPADPFVGTLQALRVAGAPVYPTTTMEVGQRVIIEWVDVPDPDPPIDVIRGEAHAAGAATFVRGEGIWFHEGAVYVCCTAGGPLSSGQIFRLTDGPATATLELIARSEDTAVLDRPDNITVAPWGELFMAEDGSGDNYIRVLTKGGEIYDFARNARSSSELTGVCFAPDGRTLFVNLQVDGITLAISGPFNEQDGPGEPEPTTGEASGDGGSSGAFPGTSGGPDDGDTGDTFYAALDDDGCGCSAADASPTAQLAAAAGALALAAASRRKG